MDFTETNHLQRAQVQSNINILIWQPVVTIEERIQGHLHNPRSFPYIFVKKFINIRYSLKYIP